MPMGLLGQQEEKQKRNENEDKALLGSTLISNNRTDQALQTLIPPSRTHKTDFPLQDAEEKRLKKGGIRAKTLSDAGVNRLPQMYIVVSEFIRSSQKSSWLNSEQQAYMFPKHSALVQRFFLCLKY